MTITLPSKIQVDYVSALLDTTLMIHFKSVANAHKNALCVIIQQISALYVQKEPTEYITTNVLRNVLLDMSGMMSLGFAFMNL